MTDNSKTAIGILVDRSGSMSAIKADMEGGINTFITSQQGQGGTAYLTLADFDTNYRVVFDAVNVDTGADLNYTLEPRGGTALNDSVGNFVTSLGESLRAMNEEDRPGKVIVVIVTDGYENSSREWTTDAVRKLITQQQDTWNWEFVFLGKDINSFAQADAYGINRASTIDFTNAPVAMAATSNFVGNSRSGMSYADNAAQTYSPKVRQAAMDEEEE